MHHPTDIIHTTAFVTPVVEHWLEREIAQWVHPMNDRSNDPSHHERTLLPQSYILLWPEDKKIYCQKHHLYKSQHDIIKLSDFAVYSSSELKLLLSERTRGCIVDKLSKTGCQVNILNPYCF